jgi:large subunit ribosomal protein L21
MAYAIIKADGKSFKVAVGDKVNMNSLDLAEGDTTTFDQVLAFGEGENIRLGSPTIEGASVTAKVVKQYKAPKVIIFHFKRRKGFHKKKGHRQPMTELEITGINA